MNNKNTDPVDSEAYRNQKQFICDRCQKECFTRVQYQVHSIIHLFSDQFNCDECQEEFNHILNLDKHLEMHSNSISIFCQLCNKEFFDIDSLNEHAEDHNSECNNTLILKQETDNEETFFGKCDSSHNERNEQCAIENHILSDNLRNLFVCDRCKERFSEKHHLDEHCKNPCIKKELDSNKCKKLDSETFNIIDNFHVSDDDDDDVDDPLSSYYNESSAKCALENHISNENLQNLFRYERCKKELDCDENKEVSPFTLCHASSEDDNVTSPQVSQKCKNVSVFTAKVQQRRSKKYHIKAQFVCKVCQKVFSNKYSLTIHFSTHSDQKMFNCYLCKKNFSLKCLLHAHVRIHTAKKVFASKGKLFEHPVVKSFSCNVCQMTFSNRCLLEKHYLKHIIDKRSERKHQCHVCPKKLSSELLLNVHERTHISSPPYVCDVCSKEFSRSHNLLRHYLIHTGEKPFECEACGKSFNQKNDVTKHFSQAHTTQEPKSPIYVNFRKKSFKCRTCGKCFTSNQNLKGHLFQHTGETPHVCFICNKGFARKFQLKNHLPSHSGK